MKRTLILLAALALSGCGGPRLAPVSGRVLVDGQPVARLRLSFAPMGTKDSPIAGPAAYGYTDEQGRYFLKSIEAGYRGVPPGKCRVRIQVSPGAGEQKIEGDAMEAWKAKRLPPRYNDETTLEFEVPEGGTDSADFAVSWK